MASRGVGHAAGKKVAERRQAVPGQSAHVDVSLGQMQNSRRETSIGTNADLLASSIKSCWAFQSSARTFSQVRQASCCHRAPADEQPSELAKGNEMPEGGMCTPIGRLQVLQASAVSLEEPCFPEGLTQRPQHTPCLGTCKNVERLTGHDGTLLYVREERAGSNPRFLALGMLSWQEGSTTFTFWTCTLEERRPNQRLQGGVLRGTVG